MISEATGLDRADFTSHQARRTLMRLGFSAGRRGDRPPIRPPERGEGTEPARTPASDGLGEELETLTGQWVAIKGEEVLHSADSPRALVEWLTRHGQRADSMFRVPDDTLAASGLAPL